MQLINVFDNRLITVMHFLKYSPPETLSHLVREIWLVENVEADPVVQKIIPDGFCEIIFHFGDPYRIRLSSKWETQERMLFSGQIKKYFFLENTGTTRMLGFTLMPDTAYILFGMQMDALTERVVPLHRVTQNRPPDTLLQMEISPEERVAQAISWIQMLTHNKVSSTRISPVISDILAARGMLDIESLAHTHALTRRHLERAFKTIVGLTPKYFSRIIQFSYIFEAMQRADKSWVDVALDSGYFDQSHFIRNFKAFTGESPARYGFGEENLANFFLRK